MNFQESVEYLRRLDYELSFKKFWIEIFNLCLDTERLIRLLTVIRRAKLLFGLWILL